MLGDQSPWTGGLLRWLAVKRFYPKEKVLYFLHDGDAPWMQRGGSLKISHGWVKYWSIASRNALALDVPDSALHNVRESIKGPKGLSYIAGPKTTQTIFSTEHDKSVQGFISQLLDDECRWYSRIAESFDVRPAYTAKEGLFNAGPLEVSRRLAGEMNMDGKEINSVVELFLQEPLLIKKVLPTPYFWSIGKDGCRYPCTSLSGSDPVTPKAAALVLEFAARGHTLGCTSLGYLSEVIELRDKYFRGMKLKLLYVKFNWTFTGVDPYEKLLSEFCSRKKLRGEPIPSFDDALPVIQNYWRGRPTVLGWLHLGGELSPSCEEIEV